MNNMTLNKEDLALAYQLAELYYQIDKNCNLVSNIDKERLYEAVTRNPYIHYKALELNRIKDIESVR